MVKNCKAPLDQLTERENEQQGAVAESHEIMQMPGARCLDNYEHGQQTRGPYLKSHQQCLGPLYESYLSSFHSPRRSSLYTYIFSRCTLSE